MAQFLNTSATTYYLENLIKKARERLYLISPYLKLNERIKELLEDKNRMKIDIRIVYGKSELQPSEAAWLKNLSYIRTSYCHNLHAKCYISENECIITSLNLYEFSQVNNNEMGILLTRDGDNAVYHDAYEEAQRIIRISDEVKISVDVVPPEQKAEPTTPPDGQPVITTAKLAEKWGIERSECNKRLCEAGLQELKDKKYFLTEAGKMAGGTLKKGQYGWFIVWPEDLTI